MNLAHNDFVEFHFFELFLFLPQGTRILLKITYDTKLGNVLLFITNLS